jgi:Na+-translocating ferredoxin:NAD+ oxidoreductase subunit C
MISRRTGIGLASRAGFSPHTSAKPLVNLAPPAQLAFALVSPSGAAVRPLVEEGQQVEAGRFLGHDGDRPVVICPWPGRVSGIAASSGPPGSGGAPVVTIAPGPASAPPAAFPRLAEDAGPAEVWPRLAAVGLLIAGRGPRRLGDLIGPEAGPVTTLVVSAADREPGVSAALQTFRERSDESCQAALMLRAASRAGRVLIAAPRAVAAETRRVCYRYKLDLLEVPDAYPQGLAPLMARRLKDLSAKVVPVETALAALDAVREGRVPERKAMTVIGPGRRIAGNFRVPLGMSLGSLLAAAGLHPGPDSRAVWGGPMRGVAVSLATPVDAGADAAMLLGPEEAEAGAGGPCLNCGQCVSVCPVRLQPQAIGRAMERNRAVRAEALHAGLCLECGLCAAVCPARRPLLTWLTRAKGRQEATV